MKKQLIGKGKLVPKGTSKGTLIAKGRVIPKSIVNKKPPVRKSTIKRYV